MGLSVAQYDNGSLSLLHGSRQFEEPDMPRVWQGHQWDFWNGRTRYTFRRPSTTQF